MIIWVHCNKCYTRFATQIKFFITNCYHVYCEKCLDKVQQTDVCLLCNASKPAILALSNDMPESVKALFGSFEGNIDRTYSMAKFQMNNCLNLLKQTITKYNQLKVEYLKVNRTLNAQKCELRKLKEALLMRSTSSANTYGASTSGMMDPNASLSSSPVNVSFSNFQNPYSASNIPSNHRYSCQQQRMPSQYPGQAQRIHQGRQMPFRPSPVLIAPTHLSSGGSRGSSAVSSVRNEIFLSSSAQRRRNIYKMDHLKF